MTMRSVGWRAALVAGGVLASGCRPDLAGRHEAGGGGGGGGGGGAISFAIEPSAPRDAAPRALRLHLSRASGVDGALVRLVRGEVGPGHVKQLANDDPSNALLERILPATLFEEGGDLVVAPHALLEPDAPYALVVPDVGEVFSFRTAALGVILARAWPPSEQLADPAAALVFCGEASLPPLALPVALAPSLAPGRVVRGAVSTDAGDRCVRVVADAPVDVGTSILPPPSLEVPAVEPAMQLGLDPTPMVVGRATLPPVAAVACDPLERRFGDACALVLDDRLVVRSPAAARLWGVAGSGVDAAQVTAPGEPFVVYPLPVASAVALDVVAVDAAGIEVRWPFTATTASAMAHVVINEVLANAVGPEPASEWVELVNDGAVAARLGGWILADLGGEVELPDVVLAPGDIVLLVSEAWLGDGLDDVAPPPGTRIVRVPRLGRSGLANGGEPLRLRDVSGAIVSTVPSIAAEEPGMSTARREPWLADTPSSFRAAVPTPGAPNQGP